MKNHSRKNFIFKYLIFIVKTYSQWMYNVRVIEPDILKTYYEKTIKEIQINNNSKLPLVYRNIFINNQ